MTTATTSSVLASPPASAPALPEPRLAIGLIATFAVLKLAMHFTAATVTPYEIHRDEFLYLSMGEHLRFWSMDFPPGIAVLANACRGLFGDTLFAVRFFPAVGGTMLVIFTGLIAREFGGGRVAQGLAMLATFGGPLFMRPSALFHPVVWDQLWWTVGLFALARIMKDLHGKWWLLLGITGGLGLLFKFSILFFACAVFVSLLLSRHRAVMLTRWPWVAVGMALLIGSPSIVGQLRLDLPVIIHMSDLQSQQLQRISFADFLSGQVFMLGPAVVLAFAGLLWLLIAERGRQFRLIGTVCVTAFLLLMVLHGKAYYIGPIYPASFAAGAVCLADIPAKRGSITQAVAVLVLLLASALALPFGLPILPPAHMAQFCEKVGIKTAVTTNRGKVLLLPQDYADMLGWEDQAKAVSRAFQTLPPEKRQKTGLVARNYGEAGALEFYGPRHGLPRKVMLPDNFQLWPPDNTCTVVVTIGIPPGDIARFFRIVKVAEHFDNPWMVEEERNLPICIAEEPIDEISKAWVKRTGWR